jgi:hypothetical protein
LDERSEVVTRKIHDGDLGADCCCGVLVVVCTVIMGGGTKKGSRFQFRGINPI